MRANATCDNIIVHVEMIIALVVLVVGAVFAVLQRLTDCNAAACGPEIQYENAASATTCSLSPRSSFSEFEHVDI